MHCGRLVCPFSHDIYLHLSLHVGNIVLSSRDSACQLASLLEQCGLSHLVLDSLSAHNTPSCRLKAAWLLAVMLPSIQGKQLDEHFVQLGIFNSLSECFESGDEQNMLWCARGLKTLLRRFTPQIHALVLIRSCSVLAVPDCSEELVECVSDVVRMILEQHPGGLAQVLPLIQGEPTSGARSALKVMTEISSVDVSISDVIITVVRKWIVHSDDQVRNAALAASTQLSDPLYMDLLQHANHPPTSRNACWAVVVGLFRNKISKLDAETALSSANRLHLKMEPCGNCSHCVVNEDFVDFQKVHDELPKQRILSALSSRPLCSVLDGDSLYFEAMVLENKRKHGPIDSELSIHAAIGFALGNHNSSRHVGWEKGSIGYHGDDGRVFCETSNSHDPGCVRPRSSCAWKVGDVIGCGLVLQAAQHGCQRPDANDGVVFFTHNGALVEYCARGPKWSSQPLYAAVSCRAHGVKFKLNFQGPFAFPVKEHVCNIEFESHGSIAT